MREFFGIGGYSRTPEGYMSWQHLTFVGLLLALMFFLGIFLGIKYRGKDDKDKNKIVIISAIAIDAVELIKLISFYINAAIDPNGSVWRTILINLPLFLCSIQLIALPIAAFTKGRVKEAALDFVFIFGLLGAVTGTIGAGQNYNAYPVLGIHNVASGITHSISGFASLFVGISGYASLKKENGIITILILTTFIVLALIADLTIPYNYMFLMNHDGTPYSIFYNMVNGNKVLYPIIVILLFYIFIALFYLVSILIRKHKKS